MQRKDKGGDVGLRREERSTRGKRMRAALEDESEGDQEFWNQVSASKRNIVLQCVCQGTE
eukprot:1153946-Pelagomonas_calceolata.AAC.1